MPPKRVYVGNLPRDVREYEIDDLFRDYGPDDITVKEGFAFLIFDDAEAGEDAIRDLDGRQYNGRRVRVEEANKKPGRSGRGGFGDNRGGRDRDRSRYERDRRPRSSSPRFARRGDYRLMIEDLPYRASWQDLKDFARDKGAPRPVGTEVYNKSGNTIGLLEFVSRDDLEEAIDRLDRQKIVPGKGARHHYPATTIRCYEDCRSQSRSRGRRRSRSDRRSRSRSPRRSRSRQRDALDRDRSYDRESTRHRDTSRERDRGRSRRRKRDSREKERSSSKKRIRQRDEKGSRSPEESIKEESIKEETSDIRDNRESSVNNDLVQSSLV